MKISAVSDFPFLLGKGLGKVGANGQRVTWVGANGQRADQHCMG